MTVSDHEFTVNNTDLPWPFEDPKTGNYPFWDEVVQKSFVLPFDSQAAISTYILLECDKNKSCRKEAKPKIEEKLRQLEKLKQLK